MAALHTALLRCLLMTSALLSIQSEQFFMLPATAKFLATPMSRPSVFNWKSHQVFSCRFSFASSCAQPLEVKISTEQPVKAAVVVYWLPQNSTFKSRRRRGFNATKTDGDSLKKIGLVFSSSLSLHPNTSIHTFWFFTKRMWEEERQARWSIGDTVADITVR